MSKDWNEAIAAAEAAAEQKQAAEEVAQARFEAARTAIEAEGRAAHVTETPEFGEWMAARRASDEAWGAWAMVMDAKPGA